MKNNFKIRNLTEEVKSEIQSDEVKSVSSPDAINSLSKYGSFYTSNTDIEMKDVQKQKQQKGLKFKITSSSSTTHTEKEDPIKGVSLLRKQNVSPIKKKLVGQDKNK